MSGTYGLIFFRSVIARNIYSKHQCSRITLCGTYKVVINRNIHSSVSYSRKLLVLNSRSIKTNYAKCLSCSSKHVNYNAKDKDQGKPPVKEGNKIVYYFKKVRFVATIFWNGCKNLYSDVKLALKTRRKLRDYNGDYSNITREELRHMRQTKDDVKKSLPAVVIFWIPTVGYFLPLIAFAYPKQMLSEHFWNPDQKKKFILEEYEKRSQYYVPLVKEIASTCKESEIKDLYKFCFHVINGNHPSNAEFLQFKDIFSKNGNFSLESVSCSHLDKLCKCWLIPTGRFVPRWYLLRQLRTSISRLHEDDMLILRDGIKTLPPQSVVKAVHERGLDISTLNLESKTLWLQEWIEISSQESGADGVSFLAHCAAFKGANFAKIARENGSV